MPFSRFKLVLTLPIFLHYCRSIEKKKKNNSNTNRNTKINSYSCENKQKHACKQTEKGISWLTS